MTEVVHTPDQNVPVPPSPEVNFALVLSRMIDSVQQNPAELRAAVYELARIKLMEQFGREDAREVKRLVGALEEAIGGVEAFSRHEDEQKAYATGLAAPGQTAERPALTHTKSGIEPGVGGSSVRDGGQSAVSKGGPIKLARARSSSSSGAGKRSRGPFSFVVRLGIVLSVVALIVASVLAWPRLRIQMASLKSIFGKQTIVAVPADRDKQADAQSPIAATPTPPLVPDRPALPFPLPSTFGVYAIADGQLQELKVLPGKVPDARVAVSAAITTPSETTLAVGQAKFVVFRRDGAANAPDRVDVRIVARVIRAMGVDETGKAKITHAQDAWVVRNVAIPYKVGPVDNLHPEMFLIQPEATDAPLPAGRYAIVIKGQGYDFTVDGPVTDPRQCVERVDAANGTFYSPCR